jgi:hypothetical protein
MRLNTPMARVAASNTSQRLAIEIKMNSSWHLCPLLSGL